MMSKLKKLSEEFPRYDITVDLTTTNDANNPFGAKVVITILGDGNQFSKRVMADSFGKPTGAEAEQEALDKAIDRVLCKGELKCLSKFPFFDVALTSVAGNKAAPVCMKASITIFGDDNKVIRRVQAVGLGTDSAVVEKDVLKGAIEKLGVK